MALMPKRVKWRKSQRGTVRAKAGRGNTLSFGEYGIQTLASGWITGVYPFQDRIMECLFPSRCHDTTRTKMVPRS